MARIATLKGDREYCEYCHGYTATTDRGLCCACGAQREKELEVDPDAEYGSTFWTDTDAVFGDTDICEEEV